MQNWIKFVPTEALVEGEHYFVTRHFNKGDPYHEGCLFLSRGLNGKVAFSGKPGIAIRMVCDDALRSLLGKNPDLSVVSIPADADKRWKARKRKLWPRKS